MACRVFRFVMVLAVSILIPAAAGAVPLKAVATVGMIGDVVATVGGRCVETTTLMGAGVDPHLYRARAGDVRALQGADVIFHAGHHLEGQLGEVLARFGRTTPTVAVAERAVPHDRTLTTPEGAVDPHVWMDASLWALTVPVVADTLAGLRPDCADEFRAAADELARGIASLHDWVGRAVDSVPARSRVLVTAHDAFGYYGRAYGLEVIGIQGISTDSEAGIADIRAVAKRTAEQGIPAIFVESTINPRTVRAVVEAARERGHSLSIGGELLSDAMGAPGTPEGTYIGMILANTRRIVTALGGRPPPLPPGLGSLPLIGEAAP